jgi:hypothetical protein
MILHDHGDVEKKSDDDDDEKMSLLKDINDEEARMSHLELVMH